MSTPSLTALCAVNRKRVEEAVRPNQRSKRSAKARLGGGGVRRGEGTVTSFYHIYN